jgi:tRNA G10  N-methylase Trm11
MEKLSTKVLKYYSEVLPNSFIYGDSFWQDSTTKWPDSINNLDAIITSPPFFDSTRFYSANWIRLWFCGWNKEDFHTKPQNYIDEIQKKDLAIYSSIFRQAKERLKQDGVMVLHLGKSKKCDMGKSLVKLSIPFFTHNEIFAEDVTHCNTFGIKDVGTVTDHQYLILW